MTEAEIIDRALENLKKGIQITGKWAQKGYKQLDGQLTLSLDDERVLFNTEIKTELRNQLIPQILDYNRRYPPFILVAGRLLPRVKQELRENNVAYLEANGNFYLRRDQKWFFIDTNPPLPLEKETPNRAFARTGLKVLFEFLLDKNLINQSYRQIAEYTGTAVGNVANIINGLKQDGFLLTATKDQLTVTNQEDLIQKWAAAYERKLKPTLKIATFRFANENDDANWNAVNLDQEKNWWGGEPAGDLLTNYLRPGTLTLYTDETRNELMKNYKLIPDEHGRLTAYKKFWVNTGTQPKVVPPLLAYADLITKNDKRCRETAEKIYEQFIRPNL